MKKAGLFQSIRIKRPRFNAFDLGHEKKLSCNMGELIPILLQEVVPGDKFRGSSEMLLRMAPMVAPVMHRVNVYTHYFFVPNRLVWANWESFITGGATGNEAPVFPRMIIENATKAQFNVGTLADYMGVPTPDQVAAWVNSTYVNPLPFRAYQLIYNEYYRDQTLQPEIAVTNNDTVDPAEQILLTTLRNRAWEKDYFTSCLPWAQRGGDVDLPIDNTVSYDTTSTYKLAAGGVPSGGAATHSGTGDLLDSLNAATRVENIDEVTSSITVNELRRSIKLQEWLEKNATAGGRYTEQILAHFGIRVPDFRLMRPEYIGGGKSPVVISEVLNTTGTATAPQGSMAGHGVSVGNTHGFNYSAAEHGWIIGIMSVLPRTAYQQGLPRHFSKFDKFDYYWPEFANIGEQQVLNSEVYFPFTEAGAPASQFGYQSRYAEYKFGNSQVHGDFRASLYHWHMGRIFASAPALNASFIESNPTNRIFAVVDSSDKLYVQIYNDVKAIRPMPMFGTPTF